MVNQPSWLVYSCHLMPYATLSLCLRRRRKGRGQSFEPCAFFFGTMWIWKALQKYCAKMCQSHGTGILGLILTNKITYTKFSLGRMWLNYQMCGTKPHADADAPVLLCCWSVKSLPPKVVTTRPKDETPEDKKARKASVKAQLQQCSAFLDSSLFVALFQGSLTPKMLWLRQVSCQEMRRICRQMKKERPDLRKARATCNIMQHHATSCGNRQDPKSTATSQLSEPQVRRCTRKRPPSCQAIWIASSNSPSSLNIVSLLPFFQTQNSILSWTQEGGLVQLAARYFNQKLFLAKSRQHRVICFRDLLFH